MAGIVSLCIVIGFPAPTRVCPAGSQFSSLGPFFIGVRGSEASQYTEWLFNSDKEEQRLLTLLFCLFSPFPPGIGVNHESLSDE